MASAHPAQSLASGRFAVFLQPYAFLRNGFVAPVEMPPSTRQRPDRNVKALLDRQDTHAAVEIGSAAGTPASVIAIADVTRAILVSYRTLFAPVRNSPGGQQLTGPHGRTQSIGEAS